MPKRLLIAVSLCVSTLLVQAPQALGAQTKPPTKECNKTDLSGCYTYQESQKIADYSIRYVRRAFDKVYPQMKDPNKFWYVPHGSRLAWCGSTVNSTVYAYCLTNNTMALGQDSLWWFYDKAGDAGPLFGVAHEWGHHIQVMKGVPRGKGRQGINFENQADCIGGAFMRQLQLDGVFTKDDLDDIDNMMPLIASVPETDPSSGGSRDHGTEQERRESTLLGIRGGFKACNAHFPDTPIYGGP